MSPRRLPLLAERAIGEVQVTRHELATKFETHLRGAARGAISCGPGCASCCSHPVSISILEGLALYDWLVAHGKWTPGLRTKLSDAAEHTFGVSEAVWLLSNTPCPLLGPANLCSVYDARPFQCRTTWAVGDPAYCHPHKMGRDALVVQRGSIGTDFELAERKHLAAQGLKAVILPLAFSVLLAERIRNGEVDLEAADRATFRAYVDFG